MAVGIIVGVTLGSGVAHLKSYTTVVGELEGTSDPPNPIFMSHVPSIELAWSGV